MNLDVILLVLLVAGGLLTVLTADLLKSAIALALASALLAVIMFRMAAPLAAVFELSVCAGLITVVFISVISLTRAPAGDAGGRRGFGRFILVPALILIAGVVFALVNWGAGLESLPAQIQDGDIRRVLWSERKLDLFGQVLVLLAGIFGVVVLFKEKKGRG